MTGGLAVRSDAATHPGARRTENQDAFLDRPDLGLWAVADGAGGHHSGAFAARAAIAALESVPPGLAGAEVLAQVRLRLAAVHADLRERAATLDAGAVIASTIVVLIARGAHFACLWSGDSRAYHHRGGVCEPLTRDHSLVQELIESGAIAAAAARSHPAAHVITHALGADEEALWLEKVTGRLLPGDRFLLCCDGLSKALDDVELAAFLAMADEGGAAQRMLEAALARDVSDNVTAVTISVTGTVSERDLRTEETLGPVSSCESCPPGPSGS